MHLPPNTLLQGGKYRIERVLGQGGFGITYLATQVMLDRQVAIKEFFMKDYCSRDEQTRLMTSPSTGTARQVEQYRAKFVKEARALAALKHPNIIGVIDVFEENGTTYYSMPYMPNGSLLDKVKRVGPLDEKTALRYVQQVASALDYMHKEKYQCHYDVKPANILLDNKGNAILIDFGIAKSYDKDGHETSATPVGLSFGFAPIEQYQGQVSEFSPESDVYALGATLYYLLTANIPASAVERVNGASLTIPSSVSSSTRQIIEKSMIISRQERPNKMALFLNGGVNKTFFKWTILGVILCLIICCAYLGTILFPNGTKKPEKVLMIDTTKAINDSLPITPRNIIRQQYNERDAMLFISDFYKEYTNYIMNNQHQKAVDLVKKSSTNSFYKDYLNAGRGEYGEPYDMITGESSFLYDFKYEGINALDNSCFSVRLSYSVEDENGVRKELSSVEVAVEWNNGCYLIDKTKGGWF